MAKTKSDFHESLHKYILTKCLACGYMRRECDVESLFRCPKCRKDYSIEVDRLEKLNKPPEPYKPNRFSKDTFKSILIAISFLCIYSIVSLLTNKAVIPTKYGPNTVIAGDAVAWIVAAILIYVFIFVIMLIDHFDTRDNERYYDFVGKVLVILAFGCMIVGLVIFAMSYA